MRPDSDASLSHRSNRPTAPPQGPGVLANQLEISNANSGTRQPLALVVALWPAVRTHPALHFIDSSVLWRASDHVRRCVKA